MAQLPPSLPTPRGPLTEVLFDFLRLGSGVLPSVSEYWLGGDALGDDDLQLALYCCYELHYRGFDLHQDFEWDPSVLRFRGELERVVEEALRDLPPCVVPGGPTPEEQLATIISSADGPSLSSWVEQHGTLDHLREFAVHRSLYQLKEADAHTWGIPRYSGRSRSALIEIQMDEYGGGVPGAAHAELFARTMAALDLDPTYGAYLETVGAPTLATTNLISWFGLHRRLLPALLGHLAIFEMTSVEPMRRYARACRRLGLGAEATRFYDVHVEADAHHGPLAAHRLVGDYVRENPTSLALVMWGARSLMHVERRFAESVLQRWTAGHSSLRETERPAACP
ncbi:MAG: iron-containing redox enzyme family protein [Acidimicrobiales bacterium]